MNAEPDILALSRRLIPASGNDWGAIARRGRAERQFLARISPLVHPDFETVWPRYGEEARISTGLDATLAGLRQIGQAFEHLVAMPELYVDLGDRVLVLLRREGRTTDGYQFDEPGAALYVFEEGLLRRLQLYADREQPLADAGITAEEAQKRGVPPVDEGQAEPR
jgi:ketosteroid isomerase-like protein